MIQYIIWWYDILLFISFASLLVYCYAKMQFCWCHLSMYENVIKRRHGWKFLWSQLFIPDKHNHKFWCSWKLYYWPVNCIFMHCNINSVWLNLPSFRVLSINAVLGSALTILHECIPKICEVRCCSNCCNIQNYGNMVPSTSIIKCLKTEIFFSVSTACESTWWPRNSDAGATEPGWQYHWTWWI